MHQKVSVKLSQARGWLLPGNCTGQPSSTWQLCVNDHIDQACL